MEKQNRLYYVFFSIRKKKKKIPHDFLMEKKIGCTMFFFLLEKKKKKFPTIFLWKKNRLH